MDGPNHEYALGRMHFSSPNIAKISGALVQGLLIAEIAFRCMRHNWCVKYSARGVRIGRNHINIIHTHTQPPRPRALHPLRCGVMIALMPRRNA
jgi:hypothetical protein